MLGAAARPSETVVVPAPGARARPSETAVAPALGVRAWPSETAVAPALGVRARPSETVVAPALGARARLSETAVAPEWRWQGQPPGLECGGFEIGWRDRMRSVACVVVVVMAAAMVGGCTAARRVPVPVAGMTPEQAMEEIEKCGGSVVREVGGPGGAVVVVVEVDFDGKGKVEEGLAYVAALKHVRTLDLSMSKVTDAEVGQVAGLGQMQVLNLNFTGVTDAGLEHLGGLKGLRTLFLHGTKVTVAGVKRLQVALPGCAIQCDAGLQPLFREGADGGKGRRGG